MVRRLSAIAAGLLVVGLSGCHAPVLPPAPVLFPAPAPPPSAPAYALPTLIRVRIAGRIVTLPLEEYVLGTALAEVGPVGETPATVRRIFEVQAILARTYAVSHIGRHRDEGFDLCDGTHCQVYDAARIGKSRFTEPAREAVARTGGEVLLFAGRPAEALFHSDCGGHTAAAGAVWGGTPVPYLVGSPDAVPSLTHHQWHVDVLKEGLRLALNLDPRTAPGRRLDSLIVTERDDSGRAARVEVRGSQTHVVRGEDVRAILNRTFGERGIQSTRFTVSVQGKDVHLDGSGYGHGVGLCQTGAAARVRRGEAVDAILRAYFPGTVLKILGNRVS